jgi:DNA-binding NarL/FixJ family response regulator
MAAEAKVTSSLVYEHSSRNCLQRTFQQELLLADVTIREQTNLALLAQGKSDQEIAIELSVSVSTAKAAVSEILRKLQVESRKQAGIKARYSGLA